LQDDIQQAVHLLKKGGLVAFPTETVYGLGADAKNPEALAKIFRVKGRPIDHPLIVHVAEMSQLVDWVIEVPPVARALAVAFWPGPLTLIFKKAPQVLDMISGGQETIGIRIPHHPITKRLLKEFGGGLAAPSANRFGRISPTTAEAVREELGTSIDLVLDGGQCEVGVESTIIDVSGETPAILRPGILSKTQIESVLQQSIGNHPFNTVVESALQQSIKNHPSNTAVEPTLQQSIKNHQFNTAVRSALQQSIENHPGNTPRVSGSHESHYAPETNTYLIETKSIPQFVENMTSDQLPMAFLLIKTKLLPRDHVDCIAMSTDPRQYAHDLYSTLRELDKKNYKQIVIESVPAANVEWDAIRDRLSRASLGFVN
jgi:L-threonylcarbamoyladenylate synthase